MGTYMSTFNSKYEDIKIYMVLLPYTHYIHTYNTTPCEMFVYTNDKEYNAMIQSHIRNYLPYRFVNVETPKCFLLGD